MKSLLWLRNPIGLRTKTFHRQASPRRRWLDAALRLEALEDRTLPSVTLSGVPTFIPQGPGPMFGGGTEGLVNNPVSGAVKAIAIDPTNSNRVFIGTVNGGVWESTDATSSSPHWMPLTDLYPSLSISSIAFDPLDSTHNTLFAGVGRFSSQLSPDENSGPTLGVLRTSDGGAHWSILGRSVFGTEDVTKVVPTALSVGGHEVVVVATTGGLYRSLDDGNTFTVASGNDLPSSSVSDLIADPRSPSGLFAALQNVGIYHSTDAGKTWTETDSGVAGITGSDNIKLAAMSGPSATVLYAAVDHRIDFQVGQLSGVFRSGNAGASLVAMDLPGTTENVKGVPTFFGIHPGRQGFVHLSLAADPTDPNIVYIGGDRQPGGGFGEPDFPNASGCKDFSGRHFIGNAAAPAGSQWSALEDNGAGGTAPHADSRVMVFDSHGNILEGDDGGIYWLNTPGNPAFRHWSTAVGTLTATEFYSVAFDPLKNVIFGGAQDNGSAEQFSGGVSFGWYVVNNGDGGIAAVDVENDLFHGVIHYSSRQFLDHFQRRVFDGGGTLTKQSNPALIVNGSGQDLFHYDSTNNIENLQFVTPYVTNSVTFGRLLIGTADKVFESSDEGDTVNDVGTLGNVTALAYGGTSAGVANPDVAYVGAGHNLYLRTLAGHPFTQLTAYPGTNPTAIVLDPSDWQTAYVVDSDIRINSDHVYKTTDAGVSWDDMTGDLAQQTNNFKSIELLQQGANVALLVGAKGGLYRTLHTDFGANTTWNQVGLNLPNVPVTSVHYDLGRDALIVGTGGRGAWRLDAAAGPMTTPGLLQITGDSDPANPDDTIRLTIDPYNPLLLDVFVNSTSIPTFQVKLGTLQQIDVQAGAGVNTLIIDGSGDPTGRAVTLTSNAVGGALPVLVTFTPQELTNLVVKSGPGNDSFLLQDKPPVLNVTVDGGGGGNALSGSPVDTTWNVTGAGTGTMNGVTFKSFGTLVGDFMNDTFKFGPLGSVSGIVEGGGGNNVLDYSGNGGHTVTVNLATHSATSINGNAPNGVFDFQRVIGSTSAGDNLFGPATATAWNITGANAGSLTGPVTFAGIENLFGGAHAGVDTFKFASTGSVSGSINAGPGVNVLDYSTDGGAAATVNLQTRAATRIRGGAAGDFAGIHRFIGSSAAADMLTGANTTNNWTVSGGNAGNVNGFIFSAVENLRGGTASDTFKFSPAGSVSGSIGGGGGGDWLDYSLFTTAVSVNLATGVATHVAGGGVGKVAGIQNVTGGAGNDILVGSALGSVLIGSGGNDTITAGSGRSVLIGGTGGDVLKGGAADDLLIAGTTNFDANHAALMLILREWQRTDKTYAQRVADLKNGGGLNGSNKLIRGTTVHDDASTDTLTGGTGLDWFFANLGPGGILDHITDRNNGGAEQVN